MLDPPPPIRIKDNLFNILWNSHTHILMVFILCKVITLFTYKTNICTANTNKKNTIFCLLLCVLVKLHVLQGVSKPIFKINWNIIYCTSNTYNFIVISYTFEFSCRNMSNYNIICITIVMYYILQSFKYRCVQTPWSWQILLTFTGVNKNHTLMYINAY